jgi:hypothetical protein
MKSIIEAEDCIAIGCVEDDIVDFGLPGNVRGVLLMSEINDHFLERLHTAVDKHGTTRARGFIRFRRFHHCRRAIEGHPSSRVVDPPTTAQRWSADDRGPSSRWRRQIESRPRIPRPRVNRGLPPESVTE